MSKKKERVCLSCGLRAEQTDSWVFSVRYNRWFCCESCERVKLGRRKYRREYINCAF